MGAENDYRELMRDSYGFLFCEACGRNENGAWRLELHHIVYKSEAPYHKELENHRNKVLLCSRCHHEKAHGAKKEFRKHLVISRGLEELFDKKLL